MDTASLISHLENTLSTDNQIRKNSEKLLLNSDFNVVSEILLLITKERNNLSPEIQLIGLTMIKNRIYSDFIKNHTDSNLKSLVKSQIIEYLINFHDPFNSYNNILINMSLKIVDIILLHDDSSFQLDLLKFSNDLISSNNKTIEQFYISVLLVCQVSKRNRNLNSFELQDNISSNFLPYYYEFLKSLNDDLKINNSIDKFKLLISYKIIKNLNYIINTRISSYFQDINSNSLSNYCKLLSEILYLTILKTNDVKNSKWILKFFIKLHTRVSQYEQLKSQLSLNKNKLKFENLNYSDGFVTYLNENILKSNLNSITTYLLTSNEFLNNLVSFRNDIEKARILYYFISYLNKCLIPITFENIENNLELIISNILIPTLSINREDIENFEIDPNEFINSNLNSNLIYTNSNYSLFDISNNDINLISSTFLIKLIKIKPDIVNPLTSLIYQILSSKDLLSYSCAINILKLVQNNLDKETIIAVVNRLIEINKDLNTDDLWLRCLIYQFLSDLNINYMNLDPIENNLMISLEFSQPLPLLLTSIKLLIIKSNSNNINPIELMQILLQLNENENLEIIRDLIDLLVEKYSKELGPYSNELISSLCSLFLNTIEEENSINNSNNELDDSKEDKLIGFINNMITIIMSNNDKENIIKMNENLYQIIQIVLDNGLLDLLESIMELIEELCLNSKMILNLDIVINSFKNYGFDFYDYYLSFFKIVYSYGNLNQCNSLNELIYWILNDNEVILSSIDIANDIEFIEFLSILVSEMIVLNEDKDENNLRLSNEIFSKVIDLRFNSFEDKEDFWYNKITFRILIGGFLNKFDILISIFGDDKIKEILIRFKKLIEDEVWCTVYDLKLGMLGLLEVFKRNPNEEIKSLIMNLISDMCNKFNGAIEHRTKLLKFTIDNGENENFNEIEENVDIELDDEFEELNKVSVLDGINVIDELEKYIN